MADGIGGFPPFPEYARGLDVAAKNGIGINTVRRTVLGICVDTYKGKRDKKSEQEAHLIFFD